MSADEIYTIGHSTRSLDSFLTLLNHWSISGVADVRTSPWSRFNPHFNRPDLQMALEEKGIGYRFLGKRLGGRPDLPQLYRNGVADYEAMARLAAFQEGLDRVIDGARKHRLALMCSEHDPLDCHRCLLVGRALAERGHAMRHIMSEDHAPSQAEIERRLLELTGSNQQDFLQADEDPMVRAYREWSSRVAYPEPGTARGPEESDLRYA